MSRKKKNETATAAAPQNGEPLSSPDAGLSAVPDIIESKNILLQAPTPPAPPTPVIQEAVKTASATVPVIAIITGKKIVGGTIYMLERGKTYYVPRDVARHFSEFNIARSL